MGPSWLLFMPVKCNEIIIWGHQKESMIKILSSMGLQQWLMGKVLVVWTWRLVLKPQEPCKPDTVVCLETQCQEQCDTVRGRKRKSLKTAQISNLEKKRVTFIFCVWMLCLLAWRYIMYMYGACGDHKRVLDPLGLDLQVVGSHHVHAGNQTQDLKRSSEWSQLLSHPLIQALGIFIFSYCFSNFSHSKLQSLEVHGGGKTWWGGAECFPNQNCITQAKHSNPSGR